jgi:hypothetical protein
MLNDLKINNAREIKIVKELLMQDVEKFIQKLVQSKSQMLFPSYSGIPTFMRTPFYQDLAKLDIAMVGVAFDGGVTGRPGARLGPREIRNQSSLIKINTKKQTL